MQEAVALQRQGRLREAEKLYARVLKAAPDHFDALHLLGLTKAQSGETGEAYRLLSAALKINATPDLLINLANVLHALKRDAEALDCLDKALALQPGNLDAVHNRGNALLALGRPQDALACFDQVLARNPRHGEALLNRGSARANLGRTDLALADFDTALTLMPGHPTALYNRGNALSDLGLYAEAIAAFECALAAAPNHGATWNSSGRALQALNRHADAVASFDKAIALQKDYADARFNRALSLLTLGDLARGFAEYEWRWKRSGMTDTRRGYGKPLWLGEYPLARKTILLHAEQGLGDTIQFARYAPLLARAGATVRLEVQTELKGLLAGLTGIASCHARGEQLPAYDVHCPLGSLPLALKTEAANIPADIPYLRADEALLAKWRPRIAALPGKRVALAWAGNIGHANDRNRSVDACFARTAADARGYFLPERAARTARQRRRPAGAPGKPAPPRWRTRRHGRHRGGSRARRSDDFGRYVGGASCRRARASGLGDAALRAGLALDVIGRAKPLVSASAAVPPARARRLVERYRDAAHRIGALCRCLSRSSRRADRAHCDRLRMALEPIARGALRPADLGIGHLLGDFAPQPRRVGVPAHGRDIEPLVRLDQIDRDARPGRIVHAEREAAFRVLRLDGIRHRSFDGHSSLPF